MQFTKNYSKFVNKMNEAGYEKPFEVTTHELLAGLRHKVINIPYQWLEDVFPAAMKRDAYYHSAQCGEIFDRYYCQGQEIKDIAKALNKTPRAVSTMLFRGVYLSTNLIYTLVFHNDNTFDVVKITPQLKGV